MKAGTALSGVVDHLRQRRWDTLRAELTGWRAPELIDLLRRLEKPDRVLLFRALPRPQSARVFARLDREEEDRLLREMTDEESRQILAGLQPDERTALLSELPAPVTRRLMDLLGPEDLRRASQLLGYPEESVGRLMTPDAVSVRPDWTVVQAVDTLRTAKPEEDVGNIAYVTDEAGVLRASSRSAACSWPRRTSGSAASWTAPWSRSPPRRTAKRPSRP